MHDIGPKRRSDHAVWRTAADSGFILVQHLCFIHSAWPSVVRIALYVCSSRDCASNLASSWRTYGDVVLDARFSVTPVRVVRTRSRTHARARLQAHVHVHSRLIPAHTHARTSTTCGMLCGRMHSVQDMRRLALLVLPSAQFWPSVWVSCCAHRHPSFLPLSGHSGPGHAPAPRAATGLTLWVGMGSANAEQDQRDEQHGISCDWPTAVSSVWLNREMSPVQPQHLQDGAAFAIHAGTPSLGRCSLQPIPGGHVGC